MKENSTLNWRSTSTKILIKSYKCFTLKSEVRTKDGLEYEPESLKSMLRATNVERQSIRVTGHPNEKSLNDYNKGSEREHQDQRNIKQFLRISSVVFSNQLVRNKSSKQAAIMLSP